MNYIDISRPVGPETPLWPGSPGVNLVPLMQVASGDVANISRIDIEAHTGTHIDAPRHFVDAGETVDALSLDLLIGEVMVAEVQGNEIGADELERLALPAGTRRLLLRTGASHDASFDSAPFRQDFPALKADAARWVVAQGIELIGIDYLSIQRYDDPPDVHHVLLNAGVVILEGLRLADVEPGVYTLVCLPLHIIGAEAAPARAILLPRESQ
ncbi:MAG TPA: cyclase family protein [Gaiellaceae bacterium]